MQLPIRPPLYTHHLFQLFFTTSRSLHQFPTPPSECTTPSEPRHHHRSHHPHLDPPPLPQANTHQPEHRVDPSPVAALMGQPVIQTLTFWLSEHPSIVGFRWSHAHSWGSTWSFLFTAISLYLLLSLLLHLLLSLLRRPVPLGPLPAFHSLLMTLLSFTIFAGITLSSVAEIRDTRWFWRRSKTPFQWLLCFPLGTRPSGRVFFWSYIYYLSRFLHMIRTFFTILRRGKLVPFQLFNHSILTFMAFIWLEFSQSFQVLAILSTTLVYAVVYAYRFWIAIGLPRACFAFVVNCQMLLLGCNVACHVGVLMMHFMKGGCNGIGAWGFNSVLNAVILLLFLNFYVKIHWGYGKAALAKVEEAEAKAEEEEQVRVKDKVI